MVTIPEGNILQTPDASTEPPSQSPITEDLWNIHKELLEQNKKKFQKNSSEIEYSLELKLYLQNPPLENIHLCPFKAFWAGHKSTIQKIAFKYLSVVGSSVPCERVFSKAGHIMTETRNRLDSQRFQELVFLSSLDETDWHLNS